MAERSRFESSGKGTQTECPNCGKLWPPSLATCPDDGSDLTESTRHQDLCALDTAFLPATRQRWDERSTATDSTRIDATAVEAETELHFREFAVPVTPTSFAAVNDASQASRGITAEASHTLESTPPTGQPPSNPEPTTSVKIGQGVTHLVPGTLVSDYEVEKLLGSGAMGQVYGARNERLGKRVAIKVIAPSLSMDQAAVERFEQEGLALAKLSHPNIVSVLNVGTLAGDGRAYFVMEWLEGETFGSRLKRGGFGFDSSLDIIEQIARGLEAAHAAGIVHRDLKPDNVWLQSVTGEVRPVVKILDFGLAKLAHHRRSEHTATNVMFGTPQFMSPEQCRSSRDVGAPTDVYALGCVMFELLTGRPPFVYDNIPELIVAHQTEAPPRLRDLDPAIDPQLDELAFAILAKNPAQRPTLATLRSAIAAVRRRLAFDAPGAQPPRVSLLAVTVPRVAAPTARSRRVMLAGMAGTLLLSFLVATSLTRSHAGGHSAERSAVPDLDATVTSTSVPLPAPPQAATVQPRDDASVAVHTQPGVAPNAPRTIAPVVHDVSRERVDAGFAVGADAATATVENDVDHDTQGQPNPVPIEVKNPSVGRNALVVERKPNPSDRKPQPLERRPDRDQTFNPFKKGLR